MHALPWSHAYIVVIEHHEHAAASASPIINSSSTSSSYHQDELGPSFFSALLRQWQCARPKNWASLRISGLAMLSSEKWKKLSKMDVASEWESALKKLKVYSHIYNRSINWRKIRIKEHCELFLVWFFKDQILWDYASETGSSIVLTIYMIVTV